MNELARFEAMARSARGELTPRLDVAARVLARIRRIETRREVDVPFLAVSGLSVLAASVMLMMAVEVWLPLVDPLAGLFNSLTMVMR